MPDGTSSGAGSLPWRLTATKITAAATITAAAVPAIQIQGRAGRRGVAGLPVRGEDGGVEGRAGVMQREYSTTVRNRPAVNGDISGRWVLMAALALAGLADSLYLTWYHYDPAVRACFAVGGCETVNGSRFATLGGIPVAVIGVAGYLLIAATLAARRWGPPPLRRRARYATYGLAAAGTAFALYLTAIEAFVLHAYCTWCLISATVVTALTIAAAADLAVSDQS